MHITRLVGSILLALLLFINACAESRKPAVAGTFYPGDSASLAKMVNGHLANVTAEADVDGQLIALIVPHAGLVYSGQIAANSYKLLEGSQITTAVLCGPSHRVGFEGISVYGPGIIWRTPFGDVPCDDAMCQKLIDFGTNISVIREAHEAEHCLEVQIPYLQSTLSDFRIVPVLMGYPDRGTIQLMADALTSLNINQQTVLIASTDWQHYRPASDGWKFDSVGVACIERLDPDALERHLTSGKTEACGGGTAVAVLKAAIAKGANKVKILKYGDSGDVTGDKSGVVGYLAAAVYKSSDAPNPPKPSTDEQGKKDSADKYELTEADRQLLLEIARTSIDCHLRREPMPEYDVSDILRKNGAAFVTLTKTGQLRGCIGYTMAFKPLYETVSECAVKAAVEDPRFPPVLAKELPQLHVEISVLTPLQKVQSLDEIKVGRDGLMITLGRQRGLLLPQVATDYGWTETQFLEQTCRKAGLPLDAYKSPEAVIERFQAVIFGE
ncbi:MAG: AmmeMemoRadiSam system protein B [Candidatus Zixiibacteriota bacterium]|nr:MAG: AmmeMemoRadiSam system protein B [candidate division Zixibacteria bacterium]